MSLEDFGQKCVLLEKHSVRDEEGGWVTTYTDGSEFVIYKYRETGAEVRIAEQLGAESVYNCMVDKDVPIVQGDYFRDVKTGLTFRVTSDPAEDEAPTIASFGLQKKRFTAERRALPT